MERRGWGTRPAGVLGHLQLLLRFGSFFFLSGRHRFFRRRVATIKHRIIVLRFSLDVFVVIQVLVQN